MNKKTLKTIGFAALGCAVAAGALFLCTFKDMTGTPYSEIEAYKQAHPKKIVTYTVTVEGGEQALKLDEKSEHIVLTNGAQAYNLANVSEYLQHAQDVTLDFIPTHKELYTVVHAFPNAEILFDSFTLEGVSYPADCTTLDVSDFVYENMEETVQLLQALPKLTTVELMGKEEQLHH